MQTVDEQIAAIRDTVKQFESKIQAQKVTEAGLAKAQAHLDGLEAKYTGDAAWAQVAPLLYEMQALIDFAKGDVKRARAFAGETYKINPGYVFVSSIIGDLAENNPQNTQATEPEIDFFVVSTTRLIVLTILSFGIYPAYWFYKNWKAVERATGKPQAALAGAIFYPLFSHSLYADVKKVAEAKGYDKPFSPGWRAFWTFVIGGFGGGFLVLFLLLRVQKMMRFSGAKQHDGMNIGEIILMSIGVIYLAVVLLVALLGSTNDSPSGLVISREVFMGGCVDSATEDSNGLTSSQAQSYCGCVYDRGVERYGDEEFTRMTAELGETNRFTSDYNALINECVAQL